MRAIFFAAVLAASAAACGQPAEQAAPPAAPAARIEVVSGGWATPTPGGVNVSAGYLTIANRGTVGDRLVSASSPRASTVEIHEMLMEGAVMRMRPVEALVIPAGGEISLAPGGQHLMFIGVTEPFAEGQTIDVQLTFESAGAIDVALPVQRSPAQGDSH